MKPSFLELKTMCEVKGECHEIGDWLSVQTTWHRKINPLRSQQNNWKPNFSKSKRKDILYDFLVYNENEKEESFRPGFHGRVPDSYTYSQTPRLPGFQIPRPPDSHAGFKIPRPPDSQASRFPDPQIPGFQIPRPLDSHAGFQIPRSPDSQAARFLDPPTPRLPDSQTPRLPGFQIPRPPDYHAGF